MITPTEGLLRAAAEALNWHDGPGGPLFKLSLAGIRAADWDALTRADIEAAFLEFEGCVDQQQTDFHECDPDLEQAWNDCEAWLLANPEARDAEGAGLR